MRFNVVYQVELETNGSLSHFLVGGSKIYLCAEINQKYSDVGTSVVIVFPQAFLLLIVRQINYVKGASIEKFLSIRFSDYVKPFHV